MKVENILQKETVQEFENLLNNARNIVIVSHVNPDGDAVGSILALQNIFQNKGLNSICILPNIFPHYLNFLKNSENIIIAEKNQLQAQQTIDNADVLILCDASSFKRTGEILEPLCKSSKAKKILIDHHINPATEEFDLAFATPYVSSTSELSFLLFEKIWGNILDKAIAECIYTGICTDTGSFSYSSNFENTYIIVSKLLKAGVDTEQLHYEIYNTYSERRVRLLGFSLCNRMVVNQKYGYAYIYLSKEDLQQFDYQEGDTEGIVNYTLSMTGINVGALLTEREGKIRMSLRSQTNFDVNRFASTYFSGGGHIKASGATSYDSMENTIKKMEKSLQKEICS